MFSFIHKRKPTCAIEVKNKNGDAEPTEKKYRLQFLTPQHANRLSKYSPTYKVEDSDDHTDLFKPIVFQTKRSSLPTDRLDKLQSFLPKRRSFSGFIHGDQIDDNELPQLISPTNAKDCDPIIQYEFYSGMRERIQDRIDAIAIETRRRIYSNREMFKMAEIFSKEQGKNKEWLHELLKEFPAKQKYYNNYVDAIWSKIDVKHCIKEVKLCELKGFEMFLTQKVNSFQTLQEAMCPPKSNKIHNGVDAK